MTHSRYLSLDYITATFVHLQWYEVVQYVLSVCGNTSSVAAARHNSANGGRLFWWYESISLTSSEERVDFLSISSTGEAHRALEALVSFAMIAIDSL